MSVTLCFVVSLSPNPFPQPSLVFPPSVHEAWLNTSVLVGCCARHIFTRQQLVVNSRSAQTQLSTSLTATPALPTQLLQPLALGADSGRTIAAMAAMAAPQAAPGTHQRCKLTWKLNLLSMNESPGWRVYRARATWLDQLFAGFANLRDARRWPVDLLLDYTDHVYRGYWTSVLWSAMTQWKFYKQICRKSLNNVKKNPRNIFNCLKSDR